METNNFERLQAEVALRTMTELTIDCKSVTEEQIADQQKMITLLADIIENKHRSIKLCTEHINGDPVLHEKNMDMFRTLRQVDMAKRIDLVNLITKF